jgi:hypothetical protein
MKLPKDIQKFFERQGRIGAAKRLAMLGPERRREIAQVAASARWAEPRRCSHFLHDAMRIVLLQQPNFSANTSFLSDQIAKRGLYVKLDGGYADKHQIAVRARKYPSLFEFVDSRTVRLKHPARNTLANGGKK